MVLITLSLPYSISNASEISHFSRNGYVGVAETHWESVEKSIVDRKTVIIDFERIMNVFTSECFQITPHAVLGIYDFRFPWRGFFRLIPKGLVTTLTYKCREENESEPLFFIAKPIVSYWCHSRDWQMWPRLVFRRSRLGCCITWCFDEKIKPMKNSLYLSGQPDLICRCWMLQQDG